MTEAARPELRVLRLADPAHSWEALGFTARSGDWDIDMNYSRRYPNGPVGIIHLGGVRLELGAHGRGITGWTLSGIPSETREVDGLETALAERPSAASPQQAYAAWNDPEVRHPNGAIAIDHVVVTSPDFDRTAAALEAVGMALRRVAASSDGGRMGFRRLGPAILELVETSRADAGTARFWGLVVVVEDLDALAERLGDRLGSIRDAVQPGRRIATLRQSAGLAEAVAFMSPERPS